MRLDIRLPLGLLFAILGLMLVVFGVTSDPAIYRRSLGINVNILAGLGFFVFGAAVLSLAWRAGMRKAGPKSTHGKNA